MTKEYNFNGTKFTVSEPKDCKIKVSGLGLTAIISIHKATNSYREDLKGWGSGHNSLDAALNSACRRIIDNAGKPSEKELCSGMDEFYENLGK